MAADSPANGAPGPEPDPHPYAQLFEASRQALLTELDALEQRARARSEQDLRGAQARIAALEAQVADLQGQLARAQRGLSSIREQVERVLSGGLQSLAGLAAPTAPATFPPNGDAQGQSAGPPADQSAEVEETPEMREAQRLEEQRRALETQAATLEARLEQANSQIAERLGMQRADDDAETPTADEASDGEQERRPVWERAWRRPS